MTYRSIAISVCILLAVCATAPAEVYRVDGDVAVSGDGSSWPNAFKTIQEGIEAADAAGGGEVWVGEAADGYKSATDPVVTLKSGVHIYGGFAGTETLREQRDWAAHETIIDGGGARRCVYGQDIASGDATLDGFTMRNGKATSGAGMYNSGSSPQVANCKFLSNTASSSGGGMYNNDSSSPTVSNCTFEGNTATLAGGGMRNYSSSPQVIDCVFTGNQVTGAESDGGGMANSESSSPVVTSCRFLNNTAVDKGGGMHNYSSCSPIVTACEFVNNTAADGAGMYNNVSCTAQLANCTFEGNTATTAGGGMFNASSSPEMMDCTFAKNSASGGSGGGMYNSSASPRVTHCVFRGNVASGSIYADGGGMYYESSSSPEVSDCTFMGNRSTRRGGAISDENSNSVPRVSRCTFADNQSAYGGAICNIGAVTNCVFVGNTATSLGGALYLVSVSQVVNCTFAGNRSDAIFSYPATVQVVNSILWGNGDDPIRDTATVTYSCVEGGYAGTGNIDQNPLFVDAVAGNVQLKPSSPCQDTGTSAGAPAEDFFGLARPQGAEVDMGAYEYVDTDGDGLPDSWETHYDLDWNDDGTVDPANGANGDPDGDGLTNLREYEGNTDPQARSVWMVDAASTAESPDGSSWENAFQTIQECIDAAVAAGASSSDPAELWVAQGQYTSAVDQVVTLRRGVHLYGGFAGTETLRGERDWVTHPIIIDGQGMRRCVTGSDFAVLDGFEMQDGSAENGGGMYNSSASPRVTHCVFRGNVASGSIYAVGGGMYNESSSSPEVSDCTFVGNQATKGGGGISDENNNSVPRVSRCTFADNQSAYGGAIYNIGAVTNCVFVGNEGTSLGGALYLVSVSQVVNCTFAGNRSDAIFSYPATVQVVNSILWDNGADPISETATVTYSCVQGGYAGTGNIDKDPLFVDAASGNVQLQPESPCIDAGTLTGAPSDDLLGHPRPVGAGIDMGASEYYVDYILSPPRSGRILAGDTLRFAGKSGLQSYSWEFGDGRTSTLQNPGLVSFPELGEYVVKLSKLDALGEPLLMSQRTLTVVPNSGVAPDLTVVAVQATGGGGIGEPGEVTYTAANAGNAAVGLVNRTDALYLSTDPQLDVADTLLATASQASALGAGESYTATLNYTIPPMEDGVYYLILSLDDEWKVLEKHRLNNEYAQATQVFVPALQDGVSRTGSFPSGQRARYYRIDAPGGKSLVFTLTAPAGSFGLYASHESVPSRGEYDYGRQGLSGANQRLVIPTASPGTWYVLVYAESEPVPAEFTILAEFVDLRVLSASPQRLSAASPIDLVLEGVGFTGPIQVELVGSDETAYPVATVNVNSFSRVTVTLEPGAVPPGLYAIRVRRPDDVSYLLPAAVEIMDVPPPEIETNLVLPSRFGYHQLATVYVEYFNAGEVAMRAPLLVVTAAQNGNERALLTLDPTRVIKGFWTAVMPEGFSHSVQFLASGANTGVLEAGEGGCVAIYYAGWLKPWDFDYPPIEWNVGVLSAENDSPVDWDSLKADLRPYYVREDAWDVLWTNYTNQVGATWGDYARMLAENAAYLYRLDQRVDDVQKLAAFEFRQADGLNPLSQFAAATDAVEQAPGMPIVFRRSYAQPISRHFELGPLGRGWKHNWEVSLETKDDGTVVITDMSGTPRIFQPDSRPGGGYLAAPGDNGKLTAASGGGYLLRELEGFVHGFQADGKLVSVGDPNGNGIALEYGGDFLTRLTYAHDGQPGSQFLELAYNGSGTIQSVTDSVGRQTIFTYDASGEHLASAEAYDGLITTYAYDTNPGAASEHALTEIVFPGGTQRHYTYDTSGRLASSYRNGGAEGVLFAYDSTGGVTATDALAGWTQYYFDNSGRPASMQDALGKAAHFVYDELGRQTAVYDAEGRTFTYAYDDRGNLTAATDPLGYTTRFRYTADLNRLSWLTDANGNRTEYGYDPQGNLEAIAYANGTTQTWVTDDAGLPDVWSNRRGAQVDYDYDQNGRLTRKNYLSGGTDMEYHYDARGNLDYTVDAHGTADYTYDSDDYLTRIDYPGGRWLEFTYDAAGRRASSLDQLGHRLDYAYDHLGRLDTMTDETGAPVVEYAYDAMGRLSQKTLGNGSYTTHEYDASGQLLSLVNHNSDSTVLSFFNYTYDTRGLRVGMATHYGTWSYEYDDLGQLTHAVLVSTDPEIPSQNLTYAYDGVGNRIYTISNGLRENYTTNNMNQYTQVRDTSYDYDWDGNRTVEEAVTGTTFYTYDDENRMLSATKGSNVWEYVYNAFGGRVAASENGEMAHFVIDPIGLGNVVGEYDDTGNLIAGYDHGAGLVRTIGPDASLGYYTFDGMGNTCQLLSQAGLATNDYMYDPFGNSLYRDASASNPFEYIGELGVTREGTGLNLMRARFYDPRIGRFVSEDPIYIAGGINLYTYAANSPLSFADPSGLCDIYLPRDLYDKAKWHSRIAQAVATLACVDLALAFDFIGMTAGGIVGGLVGLGVGTVIGTPLGGIVGAAAGLTIGVEVGQVAGLVAFTWLSGEGDWYAKIRDWAEDTMNEEDGIPVAPGGNPEYCPYEEEPPDEPEVPDEAADTGSSGAGGGWDPNGKPGPGGFGDSNYVTVDSLLPYRIDFENDPTATAPAQLVVISDPLSADLDWSTFELTEVGFGDQLVTVPRGSQYFETTVPFTQDGKQLEAEIVAGLDPASGEVYAVLYTIDPETGLPPTVDYGLLPPEDGTGHGKGQISFVVRPLPDVPDGTEIRNIATIQFDFGETIATNQVDPHDPSQGTDPNKEALVTIDAIVPTATVLPLPETTCTAAFTVSWTGEDSPNGSGIASYDLFVQDDGGEWMLWINDTTQTAETFTGQDGHTYAFAACAQDNVGHLEEAPPTTAEAQTLVDVRVSVPSLVGMTESDATAAVLAAGLTIGSISHAASHTVSEGCVINQDPPAGDCLEGAKPGAAVDLVISTGSTIPVPCVTDMTLPTAQTTLKGAGLAVGTVTEEYSSTVPAGLVISQDPACGTPVAAGTAVDLVVSKGPGAPMAQDDSYSVCADAPLSVPAPGVLGNDMDPQGDPLTAILVSTVSHGALTLNADGSFKYAPDAGYAETDSFTYVANDGGFDSNVATVTISVTACEVDIAASRSFWYYKYSSPGVENITVTIDNLGADDLTALSVTEELPAGWTFDSLVSFSPSGCGPATIPSPGATGTLEFVWSCIPEFPYTFTYRVNVPTGQTGDKAFSGDVLYQRAGGPEQTAAIGGLGSISERMYHSLDYNPANNLISVSEILRVIQFYNLGGYHCAVGTEDGYEPGVPGAPDPSCLPHDNDYNPRNWMISVSEILRMIQFYNMGGYHVAEGTEDGYAPGLAAKAGTAKMNVVSDATVLALHATRHIVASGDASEVTVTFTGVGTEVVSALGLVETLPAAWTFESIVDASEPPAIAPVPGDSGELNFAWIWTPPLPAHVTYRIRSDSGKTGVTGLTGKALYRTTGPEQQAQVVNEPDGSADGHGQTPSERPGDEKPPTGIKGDVNNDGKVDAIDLQLVINAALGIPGAHDCDINTSGHVDAADIQAVIVQVWKNQGKSSSAGGITIE